LSQTDSAESEFPRFEQEQWAKILAKLHAEGRSFPKMPTPIPPTAPKDLRMGGITRQIPQGGGGDDMLLATGGSIGTFGENKVMRTLLQIILAVLCGSVALADQVILHWRTEEASKPAEGIMVWIRDDGTLLSDSGLRTSDQILHTCAEWRMQGTEPGVRIILFPKLEANRDMGVIWPLISALKEKNIGFELLIADPEADPEKDLITKNDSEQNAAGQPATRLESK